MKKRQGITIKVVFVSNYFNHHQKPFCDEMYQRLGSDFFFISTSTMREERKKLGYAQDLQPAYVILSYEDPQQKEKALSLINGADVVIAGSAPNDLLTERMRSGKLLLRYAERPYKIKPSLLKKLYHALRLRQRDLWKKNLYMLCSSAYTAGDYASIGMYRKRTYRWGYFPEVKAHDPDALMAAKRPDVLMWCGRFIDWKHPDDAIEVARRLKEDGADFHLNLVGTGEMEAHLKELVLKLGLGDCVHFLGSMPPEQVRLHMEEAGIYLFTSDRREGWGAVLNESMNSGCAVVACHAIGSVPYLVRHGENGWIYPSGNVDRLYEGVKYLLDHPEERRRMGVAAYQTMAEEWNAAVAAERICALAERLLKGESAPVLYENGPCSQAQPIEDHWFCP